MLGWIFFSIHIGAEFPNEVLERRLKVFYRPSCTF